MIRRVLMGEVAVVLCLALSAGIGLAPTTTARTIYVDCTNDSGIWDGSEQYPYRTIGSAISAAAPGDTIVVRPCVYRNANIDFGGKAITLTSTDPLDSSVVAATVIEGSDTWGYAGPVVTFASGEGPNSVLEGFTITNGQPMGSNDGSGIYCDGSSPTIRNNRITGNRSTYGGGIRCSSSSAIICNNIITENNADNGGGIRCWNSSPLICNNVITGNGANTGGGINCLMCSPTISNNTITGNGAAYYGGGTYLHHCAAGTMSNNIVAFNSSGIYNYVGYDPPTLSHNCVHNPDGYDYSGLGPGNGDIAQDPGLVAALYGRVHLQPDSPCIDAGDDAAVEPGWVDMDDQPRVQGAHVDIGVDESDGTWHDFAPAVARVALWGDDGNDGSTWALAKRTVQAAIDAVCAQGGGEVWVGAGLYTESMIFVHQYAHLYGGFAGTESARAQRNWTENVTTIDASYWGGNVLRVEAPGFRATTIDGFTIRNGSADWGGGIKCGIFFHPGPTISNNIITGNRGTAGGGIYCCYSSARICNNVITGNTATSGGGIYCRMSGPEISNNTIVANTADDGGGIYCEYSMSPISNNIVAFNSSGIRRVGTSTMPLRNNCVYNPDSYDYEGLSPGLSDTSADPLLADTGAGNYHLTAESPCINAGWNNAPGFPDTDMDGEPRIQDGTVDIGADEATPGPTVRYCFRLRGDCWHLITLPCQPANPDPWEVLDEVRPPNTPVDLLSGNLHRYYSPAQGYTTYWRRNPTPFGPITPGDGYWLWLFEDETICYDVECSAQPQTGEVYFPSSGWHLMGSPQPCHTYIDLPAWYRGTDGPYPFSAICDVWVQDPLVGWSCDLGAYDYTGLKETDNYDCLRQFKGYWLCTFVDNVTLEVPPP